MIEYTAGFLFNNAKDHVVLLLKNRPERQKGLYNAVGGKIEGDETPFECIRREAFEEIGIEIDWNFFLTIHGAEFDGDAWKIHIFWATTNLYINYPRKMEDQKPRVFPVNDLPENIMPNCRWMIPMALNIESEYLDYFEIYKRSIY